MLWLNTLKAFYSIIKICLLGNLSQWIVCRGSNIPTVLSWQWIVCRISNSPAVLSWKWIVCQRSNTPAVLSWQISHPDTHINILFFFGCTYQVCMTRKLQLLYPHALAYGSQHVFLSIVFHTLAKMHHIIVFCDISVF